MQLAIQKEPVYPAGSRGMRGGLTGTQVERDEENQTETPRMVTPSLPPSLTLLFIFDEQMYSAVLKVEWRKKEEMIEALL